MTAPAASAADTRGGGMALRALSVEECRALLGRVGWGVLATAHDEQPYAVPIAFAIDDTYLYLATGPGRKLRNLERNPSICLTVTEVRDLDRWACVVITASIQWASDLLTRAAAMRAFLERRVRGRGVSPDDVRRLLRARIARVALTEMTGRSRG